ncbi:MAG: multicopper oxidase family protein [Betaproteobacteria bacterium]|jgi:FtsP/CotA-like multicopper oxidase with cupredoxin domain|nr:multicopper oxidase family protein [Betaproteobacteria bacterium]
MSIDRIVSQRRRAVLRAAGGLAVGAVIAPSLLMAPAQGATPRVVEYRLRAGPGKAALVGPPHSDTAVWSYNAQVPGPTLRARQGDRLRVVVENALAEDTTVHWHGVRLPNAMDGVPYLTQPPIAAIGGGFVYEFDLPDAGTYWYHPHVRSSEQIGRGLSGTLIVDEHAPIRVDRDVTWVLDDWRLERSAQIRSDFGNMMDATHAGRLGNTVTINGVVPDSDNVRAGERIRLRLVNVANARIFALDFAGHEPRVVAIDGQPVEPHAPEGGRVVVAPAMRVDLVIDMAGRPGERHAVYDRYYPRQHYRVLDLAYTNEPPLRESPLDAPIRLPANPVPEPDVANAKRHRVLLGGGMMGRMMGGMTGGRMMSMRDMMGRGMAWTLNGVAENGHTPAPMFTLARGRSYVIELVNDTAWDHPMHLHGYAFRVVTRNGAPTRRRPWQDTVLLSPEDRVEIAFVADNPGDWMFHCHILEHMAAGMMGIVRVA